MDGRAGIGDQRVRPALPGAKHASRGGKHREGEGPGKKKKPARLCLVAQAGAALEDVRGHTFILARKR